jgi:integrase
MQWLTGGRARTCPGRLLQEVVDLRWEQVDLENAILHVRRVKQGTPATHPVTGRELRALRRQREQESKSPFVFVSERGTPFSNRGFQAMVERVARAAGFDMKIHPHMLRHSCGYKLANDGVDTRTIQGYLGHKSSFHSNLPAGALHGVCSALAIGRRS